MMKMDVFTAQADGARNLLQVRFCGVVTGAGLAAAGESVESLLTQLRAGFVALVDLTDVESMDLDCLPTLTRMMDLYAAAEVGRVVRVIPDGHKDIGFNILSITHYRGRVPTMTYQTRAEAEKEIGGRVEG